jgi:arylsulfatase A-like enzyme
MLASILLACAANSFLQPAPASDLAQSEPKPATVLVEPESFTDRGGWVVDQQFMDLMGSPFVMAHGLGEPVQDAVGSTRLPAPGEYRIWVRTRDWVAPWNAPGAPGRFEVKLNGQTLNTQFGIEGAAWHWQNGGVVELPTDVEITLHDLTGFNGRCDAILFAQDTTWQPPDDGKELAKFRSSQHGYSHYPPDVGDFDLVVVGGGIAGTSAAISAARLGLHVALIQDRPVLGGNGSSEVRVWPEGHTNQQPYPRVGDVVSELVRKKGGGDGNSKNAHVYDDQRKLKLAQAEPNLTLMLNQRVNSAVTDRTFSSARQGEGDNQRRKIYSVIAQHTITGERLNVRGDMFLDATGDGVLGAIVGADFEMTHEGHMGASNLWNVGATSKNEYQLLCECEDPEDPLSLNFDKSDQPAPFPRVPWAVDLKDKNFPGRGGGGNPLGQLGAWFWESGFDMHPIDDMEQVRDLNLRAMFGAWDVLKNVEELYPNHRLKWAAYIAGKRESRRLMGDMVLQGDDFRNSTPFEDAAYPCSWHIDLHFPHKSYFDDKEADPFISDYTREGKWKYKSPYWAPYRTLYSRNVSNLFMAGRNISVTHEALGAVRVMRTCGMMGEIVAMAASICKKHDTDPRGVYQNHLDELKALMTTGIGPAKPKPNVVLIIADDQGYADLGFTNTLIDVFTPRLDQLASEGIYLPNAYATSPICNPSRVGMITGRYQQRWGNYYYGGGQGIPDEVVTLPERFKAAGYATGYFGKVHTGGPDRKPDAPGFPLNWGFDRFYGTTTGGRTHYLHHSKAAVEEYGKAARQMMVAPMWDDDQQIEFDGFTTEAFGSKAREFIATNKEQPFFAVVAFNAVHNFAWQLPKAELEARGLEEFPDWDPATQDYMEWYKGVHRRAWPEGRKYYLAQLDCLDREVGRIMDQLNELGLDENTLVIYTVDNGGCVPDWADNTPLSGSKYHLLEGGTRTPTILSMPGTLPAASTNSSVFSALDIGPTICKIAGLPYKDDAFDGQNMFLVLQQNNHAADRDLHWDCGWQWSVRSGDWKLMVTENEKRAKGSADFEQVDVRMGVHLYNLADDPIEEYNLAEENPEQVQRLRELHFAWRNSIGQPLTPQ